MYNYEWDIETGGYILTSNVSGVTKELRPVFYEELDLLGFNEYWNYPKSEKPLWIYGAYGTGKSFASFILKHIIEENEEKCPQLL